MFRASTRSSRKPIRTSGANVAPSGSLASIASPDLDGRGAWVVMPTYNQAENLPAIATAVLNALPQVTLLVVDDGFPDGTGQLTGATGMGARVREVPIIFHDRTAGTSKTSRGIVLEALIVVLRRRLESLSIPHRNRRKPGRARIHWSRVRRISSARQRSRPPSPLDP